MRNKLKSKTSSKFSLYDINRLFGGPLKVIKKAHNVAGLNKFNCVFIDGWDKVTKETEFVITKLFHSVLYD